MKHTFLKVGIAAAMLSVSINASAQTLVTYLGPDDTDVPTQMLAVAEVQGGFNAFLFGSDYKNTGAMRSKLARTDKRIDYLTGTASTTLDVSAKADLNAEINVLEESKVEMNAFIDLNESKFSLFGWFMKFFV